MNDVFLIRKECGSPKVKRKVFL